MAYTRDIDLFVQILKLIQLDPSCFKLNFAKTTSATRVKLTAAGIVVFNEELSCRSKNTCEFPLKSLGTYPVSLIYSDGTGNIILK